MNVTCVRRHVARLLADLEAVADAVDDAHLRLSRDLTEVHQLTAHLACCIEIRIGRTRKLVKPTASWQDLMVRLRATRMAAAEVLEEQHRVGEARLTDRWRAADPVQENVH
jgi:hypothetical protein